MPVAAMVVDQVVIWEDSPPGAHGYRFLPGRQVHGAVHFSQGVQFIRHDFKTTDDAHRAEHFNHCQLTQLHTLHAFAQGDGQSLLCSVSRHVHSLSNACAQAQ
jgi:hypothetical protein